MESVSAIQEFEDVFLIDLLSISTNIDSELDDKPIFIPTYCMASIEL